MKILYVLPHCSTGGMPQYVLKLIEETIKEHHVEVVEVNNLSNDYVVQRNKIGDIVLLHQLYGDQKILLELIQGFDVIHFQEIPETFIDISVLNKLYRKGRKYDIVVTTHSSYTDPTSIRYTADKFVLVSEWSKKRFEQVFPGICEIWEYPIETINYNKEQAKEHLGWDKSYKHVLHVGLFTAGKNQKELIEIAKLCTSDKILFHFVGNQAPNFEDYWRPLMKDLPSNCIIHGEVNNPEDYYKASDLFYFPSLFELNPLAVKEALSYGLVTMLRKLDTYENVYNGLVDYITDDINTNCHKLLKNLSLQKEIPGWFSYSELYNQFITEAKDGSTIVEIGSWFGKSTKYLLDRIFQSGKSIKVEVIDTFKGSLNESIHQNIVQSYDGDIYQTFYENIDFNNDVIVHKNYSNDSAELFENSSIDFLMIDADHSYEAVTSDIKNYFNKVKPGGIISGDDYNVFEGVTKAVNEYFLNAHSITGINWFYRKPKIQIIHVSTIPLQDRAKKSLKNIELLKKYGIDIKMVCNQPYTGEIDVSKYYDPSNKNLKPSHYGCYLGHTEALKSIDDSYDYTIIMEEDAYIYSSVREFIDVLYKAIFSCQTDKDIAYVSFGSDTWQNVKSYNSLFNQCQYQILAHCYLIPNYHKQWYMEKIENSPWDSADLWYNEIFIGSDKKRLVTKTVFSKQINGISVIDNIYKSY